MGGPRDMQQLQIDPWRQILLKFLIDSVKCHVSATCRHLIGDTSAPRVVILLVTRGADMSNFNKII